MQFTVNGNTGKSDVYPLLLDVTRMRYVNSDLVHPCNPVCFHAAQYGCCGYCQLR